MLTSTLYGRSITFVMSEFYDNIQIPTGEIEPAEISIHDPNLYSVNVIVQAEPGGIDAATDELIARYRQDGFLAIDDVFNAKEVGDALDGLLHLIGGDVAGFRGVQFEAAAQRHLTTMAAEQRQDFVRKLMGYVDYEPRLHQLAFHPKLIALLTRILKSAPTMFQDMALMKPPRHGREKPWHQDKAYFNMDLREQVIGVWIALDNATIANGCMHLRPDLGMVPQVHFKRRDWQICDTVIIGKPCIAVPLKPGGILLFDGLLVHGTPHNNSSARRRAVQFHYHGNQYARTSQDDRMAVFGNEGKDVQC